MNKPLIIVESPTKSKTISRFTDGKFNVAASMGHVRDLPKSKMGVDVEHNFEPHYVIPAKAKPIIKELKELAKKAPKVILATDEDREGEAIAWHLVQALGLDKTENQNSKNKNYQRIVFHEITKSAIEQALVHPRQINMNLVDAQQARRVLDRLVGYELSPFLWHKVRFGLSAGRVQSVAVRLVVEREREIQKFIKKEYWSVEAKLSKNIDTALNRSQKEKGISSPATVAGKIFTAKLQEINGQKIGKMDIKTAEEAARIVASLKDAEYRVKNIETKEVNRTPAPPFTTSTLQQEAARKLGMSAKQTMMIAQRLYEGVELGAEGHTGLITYMRTDSVNLAESALADIHQVIVKEFGQNYALDKPRYYANKIKGAQEAHEAIRPTNIFRRPEDIKQFLDRGQFRIYELIWKRTLASQMAPAVLEQTSVDISARRDRPVSTTTDCIFHATGQVIKFDGFIRAYTEGRDENGEDEIEGVLPELSAGEQLKLHELLPLQHFTEPPPRYTDATLIKALEAHGVGRPSTYAPTLSTIQERGYVKKIDKKYHPSEEGILVNDLLVEHFPEIVDINFTSHIEEELDDIAEGKIKWQEVAREFYEPFKKHLNEKMESVERQVETSQTPCPHCGKMMLIKFGRNGKFLACPDPESKVTQPLPEEQAKIDELTEKTRDEKCPLCGNEMTVRRGRFGFFLGCSRYPECKGIAKILNKTGFQCPNCNEGNIVERKSRGRGKIFYGCSRFPDCNFLMNTRPTSEADLLKALEEWKNKPLKNKKLSRS